MQEFFNLAIILLWPLICCLVYTRVNSITAAFISIVGGFLLLPVNVSIDLPIVPDIDKNFSSFIGVVLGVTIVKRQYFSWFGNDKSIKNLLILIFILTFINFIFNQDPIFNGEFWVQGLTLHEAISASMRNYLAIFPLIIGLNVVKSEDDIIKLHKILVIALLLYLPLVAVELLMSPQLHRLLYGFHPHSFAQQIRGDGYRAMVFTGHGLVTANVYLGGFIALLILFKLKKYLISKYVNLFLLFTFFVSLILLKSLTALILAVASIFILYFFGHGIRNIVVKSILLISIAYPIVITLNLLSLDYLYDLLQEVVPTERLQSLFFRLRNENAFIDYLGNNFFIGYGGLGRGFLSGGIVDGRWLVSIMHYGLFFWIVNVFIYSIYLFRVEVKSEKVILIFSVLPMVMLLDQLPNSSWNNPWAWLYAGAVISLLNIYKKHHFSK